MPAKAAYPPSAGPAGAPVATFSPSPGSTPGAQPRHKAAPTGKRKAGKGIRPKGASPARAPAGQAPKAREPAAEWVDPRSLVPWAENPRQRPAAAVVAELAQAIRTVGWGAPILARRKDRRIVAGHTRHAAALQLKLDVVPVRFLDLTNDQAAALAVADNRLQERGKWDRERLGAVLKELPPACRTWAGFTGKDLEAALKAVPSLDAPPAAAARNRTPYTIRLEEAERVAFCLVLDDVRKVRPELRAGELVAELAKAWQAPRT